MRIRTPLIAAPLLALLSACSNDTKTESVQPKAPEPVAQNTPAQRDPEYTKRLAETLSAVKQEKQVKSAAWNSEQPPYLLAGVIDDGTRRDGYAGYLCHHLTENQLYHGKVHVMDVVAADRGEWRELGSAECPESGEVTEVIFTTKP